MRDDLVSLPVAAVVMGVSRSTLWRWVRIGRIEPAILVDNHAFFNVRDLPTVEVQQTATPRVPRTLQHERTPQAQPQQHVQERVAPPAHARAHTQEQAQAPRPTVAVYDPDADM